MRSDDIRKMERERFKQMHSTKLNQLAPDAAALIGTPVTSSLTPRIMYPDKPVKTAVWTYPGIATAQEAKRAKRQAKRERRKAEHEARKQAKQPKPVSSTMEERKAFYTTWEWTTLRMKILQRYGRECMCCGARPGNGVVIHVDHIKPLSKHWELRLDPENLQVLCAECNQGKGAWDETDYRPKSAVTVSNAGGVVWGDSWDDVERQSASIASTSA